MCVCAHIHLDFFTYLDFSNLEDNSKILGSLFMDTLYYNVQVHHNLLNESCTKGYSVCFQSLDVDSLALQIYHCVTTTVENIPRVELQSQGYTCLCL